ncbi:MAG: TPM domain-containing protein [Ignavibacteria bacterium]|nr:TPM domain-containing protein [Ignavibacteria bacterium]
MANLNPIVLLIIFSGCIFAESNQKIQDDIKIRTYVTDKTGTLKPEEIGLLEKKLSDFEKETSNQVVVWMESSLGSALLEERSFEIAEKNGIGQRGKNNGVLIYIAKNDRKLRIEVGYGLEGALPDALCNQIIRKEITPEFKKGNFYEGINAGVDAIIKATRGEYTQEKTYDESSDSFMICCMPFPVFIFIVIFFLIFVISTVSRSLGWVRGGNTNWWYTGGSSWSSGSNSGGFFSGGFSGGGGSFGGGGASGSW